MARPERNNVDYFPHGVIHGKKMSYIRKVYGNDGYAAWFILLEKLGKADFHYLDLKDEIEIMYLASEILVSEDLLNRIVTDLVRMGVFDRELWEKENILFNQTFIESVHDAYKKRANDCVDRESLLTHLSIKGRIKWIDSPVNTVKGTVNPVESKPIKKDPVKPSFEGHIQQDPGPVIEATKQIAEFFDISELRQAKHFMKIGNFVRFQHSKGNLDYLAKQFKAYREIKAKNPGFRHLWENYIGSPDESYEDGAWNKQNWAEIRKKENVKTNVLPSRGVTLRNPS